MNLTDFSPAGSRTRKPGGLTKPGAQVGVAVGLALTIGFSLVHFLLDWGVQRRPTPNRTSHSPHSGFGAEIPVMPDRVTIEGSSTLAASDTTHTVTKPRVTIDGQPGAPVRARRAQHVTKASPHRHLLLKNVYDVALPVRMPAGSSS